MTKSFVDDMRSSFDGEFADSPPPPPGVSERLLAFRIAGDHYALNLLELAGLETRRRLVSLPGNVPARLGLAGIHGCLVPVYSLAGLLGYEGGVEERFRNEGEVRWLALCPLQGQGRAREDLLGLAFGDFEGYLQVPCGNILAVSSQRGARAHVMQVAQAGGQAIGVVSVASILESVGRRARTH